MTCESSTSVLQRAARICQLVALAAGLYAAPAGAQVRIDGGNAPESVGAPSEGPSEGWSYSLGLGAVAVPDYEGSENYEAAPMPVARVQKGYQYGQLFGLKLTSNLLSHPNFRAGLVADFLPERDDVENNQVDRLRTIDAALMLGGLVGYDLELQNGGLSFEVEWVHDVIDGNDGWLLTPEISYRSELSETWNLNLATSLTYASGDYMETYFSISSADSTRSGLSTFNASGGIKDVGVNLAVTYSFTENWTAGGLAGWKRLMNDAEDSPVTKVGNENQYIAGLFVTYSWQGGE